MFLLRRAHENLSSIPSRQDWITALLCYLLVLVISTFFALHEGFPRLALAPLLSPYLWLWVIIVFLSPGVTEEILFRSWILRFRDEVSRVNFCMRWVISQAAYIAWHPFFLGILIPGRMKVFGNPKFLLLAAFVGIGSSFLYLKSRSLWPSIFFHWAVVAAWYIFGGGFILLHAG